MCTLVAMNAMDVSFPLCRVSGVALPRRRRGAMRSGRQNFEFKLLSGKKYFGGEKIFGGTKTPEGYVLATHGKLEKVCQVF